MLEHMKVGLVWLATGILPCSLYIWNSGNQQWPEFSIDTTESRWGLYYDVEFHWD